MSTDGICSWRAAVIVGLACCLSGMIAMPCRCESAAGVADATGIEIAQLLDEAERALAVLDVTAARGLCQEAARRYPRDSRPLLTGSVVEYHAGDLPMAIRLCTHSLHIQPSSGALINLSRLYKAAGRNEESVNAARIATSLYPRSALAWTRLGDTYRALNLPRMGHDALMTALELRPDHAPALMALAENHLDQGQYDEAIEVLDRILLGRPDHQRALLLKGRALLDGGRSELAVRVFQSCLAASSSGASIHGVLADALVRCGSTESALAQYEEAIRLDPEDDKALYGYGMLLRQQKRNDEALEMLHRCRVIQQQRDADARLQDGRAEESVWAVWRRVMEGGARESIGAARSAVERDPEDPAAQLALATALIFTGSAAAAADHIRMGDYYGPLNSIALTNIGNALAGVGAEIPARKAWMKALYADPGNQGAIRGLVQSEIRLAAVVASATGGAAPAGKSVEGQIGVAARSWLNGRTDQAEDLLVFLTEIEPDHPSPWLLLALTRLSSEKWPEALEQLDRAIAVSKGDTWMPRFLRALVWANQERRVEAYAEWTALGVSPVAAILPPSS